MFALNRLEPSYKMRVAEGDRYDSDGSDLCIHDFIEFDKANWLAAYRRCVRKQYSVAQLEAILSNFWELPMAESTAIALIYFDKAKLSDGEARTLAVNNKRDRLEELFYSANTVMQFVMVVIALVHFDELRA